MNKTFLVEFIEEYKKFPCLWRIKSEEYRDRNLKNKAYKHLLDKMREVEADATIQMVKNKIDSMRGCFRKELKKIKDSQRSGAGEDVYIPHLWYFKNLMFLKDQETPRDGISSIDFTDDTMDSQVGSLETESVCEASVDKEFTSTPSATTSASSIYSNTSIKNRPNFKRKCNKAEEVLEKVSKQLDVEIEDRYSVIGKNIAFKLRDLPNEAMLVTEKIINDVLFEAQMGNITKHTRFNLQDTRTNVQLFHTSTPIVSQHSQRQTNLTEQYYSNFGEDLNNTYVPFE